MFTSKFVKTAVVATALVSMSENTSEALKLSLKSRVRRFQMEAATAVAPVVQRSDSAGSAVGTGREIILDLRDADSFDALDIYDLSLDKIGFKVNEQGLLTEGAKDQIRELARLERWNENDLVARAQSLASEIYRVHFDNYFSPEAIERERQQEEAAQAFRDEEEAPSTARGKLRGVLTRAMSSMSSSPRDLTLPSPRGRAFADIVTRAMSFDKRGKSDSERSTPRRAGSFANVVRSVGSQKRKMPEEVDGQQGLGEYSKDVQDLIADEELLRKKSQALLNIQVLRHEVLDNPTISSDHDLTKVADALTAIKILKVLDDPEVIKDMLENPNPELEEILAEEPFMKERVLEILNSADQREEHRIFAVRILKAFKEECSHLLPPDSKTNSSKSSTPRKSLRSLSSSKIQTAKKGHGRGLTSSMSSSGSGSVSQELAPVESSALSLGDELLSAGAVRIQEDSLREEDSGTHAETVEVFDSSPRARIPRNPSGRDYQVEVTLVSDDNAVSVDGDSDDNAVSVDGDTPRGRLTV